jgi:4a-hydroxytetrahydrobiopterin dehydratase
MKILQPLSHNEIVIALQQLNNKKLHDWQYQAEHLVARFTFQNYVATCGFVMQVSLLAEAQNHHPDIKFGWNYAEISMLTHDAGGVSERDIKLANKINLLCL